MSPITKQQARFWKINPLLKVLTPTLFVRNYGDSGQPCLHFTIVALTTTFQALSAILASGAPFAFMAATSILSLKFNPSISICLASLMSSPVFSTVSKFKLEKWYLRLKSDPRGLFLEKGWTISSRRGTRRGKNPKVSWISPPMKPCWANHGRVGLQNSKRWSINSISFIWSIFLAFIDDLSALWFGTPVRNSLYLRR